MPNVPSTCTVCTSTCTSVCGDTCVSGCSKECIDGCTGTCKEMCTLECTGGCNDSCSNGCSESCTTSCSIECVSSCLGLCQGCTGCSNTCESTCIDGCINTCKNESTNSGTRVVTEDEVLNYIANLKFKRISQFDENPAIFGSDSLITVTDPDKLADSDNTLDAISILMESKEKKTFRASAAQLMEYFNRNLKNFVMWKPYVENDKLKWKRSNDDTEPEPVDLIAMNIPMADDSTDGLMSKELYSKLQTIDISNYYDKTYIDDILSVLPETYAPKVHIHEQYLEKDNAYDKSSIDKLLETKSDVTHNHDDVYLTIENASKTYATSTSITNQFESYYTKTQIDDKFDNIVIDPDTLDIALASSERNGLMTSDQFNYITELPSLLAGISNKIPVKTSELQNDSGYLTEATVPKASKTTFGIVGANESSNIDITDDGYIDTKKSGISNLIRNSTFANGMTYWTGDPINTASITNNDGEYNAAVIFNSQDSISQDINAYWDENTTFSIEIKGTGSLHLQLGDSECDLNFDSTDWKKYSVVFSSEASDTESKRTLIISNTSESSLNISIRHLMLQNGLKPTDWYPHYLDGDTVKSKTIPYASNTEFGIVKADGVTTVIQNGVISSQSNINDDEVSTDKTWSSSKTTEEIKNISNVELLGEDGSTPAIRVVDDKTSDDGYGVVVEKTSTNFIIGLTNKDDAHGDMRTDNIPLRIDLDTGKCNINGNTMSANSAKCDEEGNVISQTYLYTTDPDKLIISESDIHSLFENT